MENTCCRWKKARLSAKVNHSDAIFFSQSCGQHFPNYWEWTIFPNIFHKVNHSRRYFFCQFAKHQGQERQEREHHFGHRDLLQARPGRWQGQPACFWLVFSWEIDGDFKEISLSEMGTLWEYHWDFSIKTWHRSIESGDFRRFQHHKEKMNRQNVGMTWTDGNLGEYRELP